MGTKTIRIRAVFRPGDADAVTVLRLLAAANDLFTVARLLPGSRDVEEETHSQKEVAGAERRYLFRMTVLHCNELLDLVNHPDYDRAVQRCARRGGAFARLPGIASSLKSKLNGRVRQVIEHLRNSFGGHYDPGAFARALELLDDGDLMDLPTPPTDASIHFTVTDRLLDALIVDRSHARFRQEDAEHSVEDAMRAVTAVVDEVMNLAIGLTFAMYQEAQGASRG